MGCTRGIKSFFQRKQLDDNASLQFLRNGSALLEELIALSGGEYSTSIRNFTVKELVKATNNFQERIGLDLGGGLFSGYLEERRPIVVRKWEPISRHRFHNLSSTVNDVAIASLMSHLKNVLKLVGCCLEFELPALVYEYAGSTLLVDFFRDFNNNRVLSWRSRIRTASDIASMIVYLHTAFPTPIIHRNLSPFNVFIDEYGVAKLFDFSFAIALPPGKSEVTDNIVIATVGFEDLEYNRSGVVTEKTDVYIFGILMLMFLTGKTEVFDDKGETVTIKEYVQENVHGNQLDKIIDPKILQEVAGMDWQAFLDLAMRCTEERGENRPDIIDVARELHLMTRIFAASS